MTCAVNLTGIFYVAQTAARQMVEGEGGVILNTASTSGSFSPRGGFASGGCRLGRRAARKSRGHTIPPGHHPEYVQTAYAR